MLNNSKKYPFKWLLWTKKIEIKKSGSAMTSAVSQLVYMPNFRAIGPSVTEKNGKRQKHRQKDRNTETQTHLNFIKIDKYLNSQITVRLSFANPFWIIFSDVKTIYILYSNCQLALNHQFRV